jgi:hypothetical protein
VYIDDLNIIGNTQDIDEAHNHLKTEIEMKDLGKTKLCLGLQLEHLPSGILVHQTAYIQKNIGEIQYGQILSIENSWLFDL